MQLTSLVNLKWPTKFCNIIKISLFRVWVQRGRTDTIIKTKDAEHASQIHITNMAMYKWRLNNSFQQDTSTSQP